MAHSMAFPDDPDEADRLTDCGICLSDIVKPKALPCLHTFCLACLKMYVTTKPPPSAFRCPLCQEKFDIPSDGVDGLKDNFFINQMKERRAILQMGDVKLTCICCGVTDRKTVARCVECNGFLCRQCFDFHTNLGPLKSHTVFTLVELRSGKVDISRVMKEACCLTHKDQVLRWFCKTCGIEICRDCTVMDHRHPEHDYVTLESVTEGQLSEIKHLVANCKGIFQQINAAVKEAEKVKTDLKEAIAGARSQLDDTKAVFLKALEENHKLSTDKLNKLEAERSNKIDIDKTNLENLRSKLKNAMEVANQIMKSGSKHDVAGNYTTLTATLAQIKDMPIRNASNSLSRVTFRPKETVTSVDLGTVEDFGTVASGGSRDRDGKWVLKKEIGKDGKGKLLGGHGVTVGQNGDVVITDFTAKNVKMFDINGKFKQVFHQGNLQSPHDVRVSTSGQYFVTDQTPYVKVYTSDGQYLKQFPVMSPDGQSSVNDGSQLYGLALDNAGHLWVGSSKGYISKHGRDGSHISTIKVNLRPWFIEASSQRIFVSSINSNTGVQILDHTGNLLHTINAPHDARSWHPTGVCCVDDDDVIYISSYHIGYIGGIYRFTMEGEYKGCVITSNLTHTFGLAMTDDKLVVAHDNRNPAQVFTFKQSVAD